MVPSIRRYACLPFISSWEKNVPPALTTLYRRGTEPRRVLMPLRYRPFVFCSSTIPLRISPLAKKRRRKRRRRRRKTPALPICSEWLTILCEKGHGPPPSSPLSPPVLVLDAFFPPKEISIFFPFSASLPRSRKPFLRRKTLLLP